MKTATLKILIIDDSPEDRAEMRRMLLAGSETRYRFIEAELGAEGLRICRDSGDGLPDVVLLDFHLPDMNAADVLAELRNGADLPPCPVVVLTGSDQESGPDLLRAGAQDYLGKSWTTVESLTRAVENSIERFALVSERTRSAERLREREHFLQRLTDVSPSIIVVFDLVEKRCVFVNRTVASVLGYSPEEIAAMGGNVVPMLMHPEDLARFPAHLERVRMLRNDETADFEHRTRDRTGEWHWFHNRDAVFARDATGAVCQLIGTAIEITERKQAEEALRESDERYRTATAAVSDLMWTNNADGLMEGEQRGWGDFTGQSRDEYQGYGWSNAVHPDDAQPTIEEWTRAVAEKRTFVFEHRVRRHDSEWRVCSARAVPILNADGTIREWVGVHTDITERKRDEARLRKLSADLSDADRRKDEFLATLAHELRNPLAPIRNGLQLLKMPGVQPAAVEQVRSMMERQLTHMVRLIDDLMDVSHITRGKLQLRKEHVPLAAVLESALETIRPLVEQAGQELTVTLPQQPLMVDADATRLAQVFQNLLHNAAKYSDRGGHIQLNVEVQERDVMVTVKDAGIGIAADQLPHIFKMFTQVDRSLEMVRGGLGVGLTLVKRLVEMHGGRVEAMSEGLGRGSEFVVRLPIVVEASNPHESGGAAEHPVTSSFRILVVDDNRDSADSLSEMLKMTGNDTRTAYDGQAGVDVAGEFRPDVILLDIGLPKLNGYEACRRIRNEPWGQRIVLIAVTGWGQDEDRRRSHEAGFDRHLVKPVDPQALMTILAGIDVAKP